MTSEVCPERTELPVRPVNGNLYGLVSLCEVLKIKAYAFISIGSSLQNLELQLAARPNEYPAWEPAFGEYLTLLNFIETGSWNMGLNHTGKIVWAIREEQRSKVLSNEDIRRSLKEINRSFVQELDGEMFVHVSGTDAIWFCKAQAFGPAVSTT